MRKTIETVDESKVKSFTMIVEQSSDGLGFQREVPHDGDSVPDVVILPEDEHGVVRGAGPLDRLFVKVGRYLSEGDRYNFRRATVLDLAGGISQADMIAALQRANRLIEWMSKHIGQMAPGSYGACYTELNEHGLFMQRLVNPVDAERGDGPE